MLPALLGHATPLRGVGAGAGSLVRLRKRIRSTRRRLRINSQSGEFVGRELGWAGDLAVHRASDTTQPLT